VVPPAVSGRPLAALRPGRAVQLRFTRPGRGFDLHRRGQAGRIGDARRAHTRHSLRWMLAAGSVSALVVVAACSDDKNATTAGSAATGAPAATSATTAGSSTTAAATTAPATSTTDAATTAAPAPTTT